MNIFMVAVPFSDCSVITGKVAMTLLCCPYRSKILEVSTTLHQMVTYSNHILILTRPESLYVPAGMTVSLGNPRRPNLPREWGVLHGKYDRYY